MKKLLFIGMLTVAGALNLHAAESKWQAKQKTAEGIQDKYQKFINDTLKPYGNHSHFIEGYLSGFQYNQNNTPEQAVEEAKKQHSFDKQVVENAKKQLEEATKQYNQAVENVTLFTKFSKNSEVTRLMKKMITILSTMSPGTELDKATQKQIKSLEDNMKKIIGKDDNPGIRNLLKTYFVQEYIKNTLKVSPKDIKKVQDYQNEQNEEIRKLYKN